MKFLLLFLLSTSAFAQFVLLEPLPIADSTLSVKGSLLTSTGTVQASFPPCANGEAIEWDNAEANGFKCVTASTGVPLMVKGEILGATDFSYPNVFSACANGESLEWDSAETLGFKCVVAGGASSFTTVGTNQIHGPLSTPRNTLLNHTYTGSNGIYVSWESSHIVGADSNIKITHTPTATPSTHADVGIIMEFQRVGLNKASTKFSFDYYAVTGSNGIARSQTIPCSSFSHYYTHADTLAGNNQYGIRIDIISADTVYYINNCRIIIKQL